MEKKKLFLLFAVILGLLQTHAQGVNPQAYYTDEDGVEQATTNIEDGEAPLTVTFRANPFDMGDYIPSFEWHFYHKGISSEGERKELFVRYEEDTQYTFAESGNYTIVLKTRLEQDGAELGDETITITIAESHLEMPNAFSPNGDDYNEIYGAKGVNKEQSQGHYKNIVNFHGYIFNRWGQKLFEWTDISKGWDGKYNGHDVKEGVYYVLVKAKGADGKEYNIKKDVNLIRGFSTEEKNSGSQ